MSTIRYMLLLLAIVLVAVEANPIQPDDIVAEEEAAIEPIEESRNDVKEASESMLCIAYTCIYMQFSCILASTTCMFAKRLARAACGGVARPSWPCCMQSLMHSNSERKNFFNKKIQQQFNYAPHVHTRGKITKCPMGLSCQCH